MNTVCEDSGKNHISVCICTYKRPEMLSNLLRKLQDQITEDLFTYSIVVVDNDHKQSAKETVLSYKNDSSVAIHYDVEPEQNIALARNRAVRNAQGSFIIFIDDDEFPVEDWLYNLYLCLKEYNADGVLGPVLPSVSPEAPEWLKRENIFNRRRFPTGTKLNSRDTRTGNVLISKSIFKERSSWFDASFGLTGGEDVDFFKKQLALGRIFVWCDEAVAYETISPERWHIAFHLKKYFKIGALNGVTLRKNGGSGVVGFCKGILSIPVWSIAFIIALPFGTNFWLPAILKLSYAISSSLSYCGIAINKQRY